MTSILSTLWFIANHPLTSKRPLSAFWRYGRWQLESRWRQEIEFEWIEGAKLIARNGMTGATGNIYCGLHEFVDMAFLLHILRPNDLFVDVGANVGSYTILASAVCGARSIAVEPDPWTVKSLQRNLDVNHLSDHVTVIQAASGAVSGTARFTVGNDTTNRVTNQGDSTTREVQVRTLDEILTGLNPVLIKMDVEGYEPEVISGAAETLRRASLLAVITETADAKVCTVLGEAGFLTVSYDPFQRKLHVESGGSHSQQSANTLFVRDPFSCNARLSDAPRRLVAGVKI